MSTKKTKLKNSPFPFMKLAPELRCKVYRNLLVRTYRVHVYFGLDELNSLAILCVSRKIHTEASYIFYGENRFIWEVTDELVTDELDELDPGDSLFIHPRYVPLLRSILINYDEDHRLAYRHCDEATRSATARVMEALVLQFSGAEVKLDHFVLYWDAVLRTIMRNDRVIKALKTLKGTKHFRLELPKDISLEKGLEEELRAELEADAAVNGRKFEVVRL
ncbi:MAG: hypothetical protein M1812_003936 [Candelaria pacifica]|nr:MAG: hypothetical protein M1812_003936 [Candelaria pacifica]